MTLRALTLASLISVSAFCAPEPKVVASSSPNYVFKKEVKKSKPLTTRDYVMMGSLVGVAGFVFYRYSVYKKMTK